MRNFYHPQKYFFIHELLLFFRKNDGPSRLRPVYKSFNQTYVDLTLKSETYKREVLQYLQN
jgi:hypothetical protein